MKETRNEACKETEERIEAYGSDLMERKRKSPDYEKVLDVYQAAQTDMIIDLLTDIAQSLSYIANRLG